MKSWLEFGLEEPELAGLGKQMLFQSGGHVGLAFLATIRKDGGPRLHPVSLVLSQGRLFVFIPPRSPKCADLQRDGRYALQAFPPPENDEGREFYLSGVAKCIHGLAAYQAVIAETGVHVEPNEVLFELLVERAMYTCLIAYDTSGEHPQHRIWPKTPRNARAYN